MQINLHSGQLPRQPGDIRRRSADAPAREGAGHASPAEGSPAAPSGVSAPAVRLASPGEATLTLGRILEAFAGEVVSSGTLFGRADGARVAVLLEPGEPGA